MIEGSCLCGGAAWAVSGPLEWITHCHCSRCRKAHGTAFASWGGTPGEGFRWLRGRELAEPYPSSPGLVRPFCRTCGSPLPQEGPEGRVFLPAGLLDVDPGVRPLAHIFVGSKAPWYEIADALPRFDAYPPGVEAPVLPDPDPPAVSEAGPPGDAAEAGAARAVRGSCLCGEVVFAVADPSGFARHCHCGRCRKARGAAHASNFGTRFDGVRFVRGEERLVRFKLPDARFFTQVFCRTCGGKLPNRDAERGIAVVPFGSLDDDPGIRPELHIFVGSKAPWFEIADALPQYAEHVPG